MYFIAFVASDPQNKSSNSSLLILKAFTDKAQWNCRGIFRESISIHWMWLWIDRTSVASGMKEGGPGSRPCTPTRQTSIPIKRERYSACSHFLPPPFFSTHFTCSWPVGRDIYAHLSGRSTAGSQGHWGRPKIQRWDKTTEGNRHETLKETEN